MHMSYCVTVAISSSLSVSASILDRSLPPTSFLGGVGIFQNSVQISLSKYSIPMPQKKNLEFPLFFDNTTLFWESRLVLGHQSFKSDSSRQQMESVLDSGQRRTGRSRTFGLLYLCNPLS